MAAGGATTDAEGGDNKDLMPPAASRRARRSLAPRVSEDRLSWNEDMMRDDEGRQPKSNRGNRERMNNPGSTLAALDGDQLSEVRECPTGYPKK